MITFDSRSIQQAIDKIRKENESISGDILDKAISRALNRTAQMLRTNANRQIRKVYNISASEINKSMKVSYSQPRTLTAKLTASGEPLSLTHFGAKQEFATGTTSFTNGRASSRITRKARTNITKGVTATIKRGETITLPTAFIQVANGGITVFARGKYKSKGEGFEFGKARLPIGKITTTSIPLMFANKEVIEPLGKLAEDILGQRIDHELNFLMR